MTPQLIERLLVDGREPLTQLHEVASGRSSTKSLPGLAGGSNAGVIRQRRVAPNAVVVLDPALGRAARCRPSPSGRRPLCPASAGSAPPHRYACSGTRARHAASPTPWEAACRSSRSRPGLSSGRTGRCRPLPSARPTSPRVLRATAFRDVRLDHRPTVPAGVGDSTRLLHARYILVQLRRTPTNAQLGLASPSDVAPVRHRRGKGGPDRARGTRAPCRCTSADRPSTARRISGTAGSRWCSTSSAGTWSGPAPRSRYVSNVTDVDDNIIAKAAAEGRTSRRGRRRVGGGLVARRWTPSASSVRPRTRTPRRTSTNGRRVANWLTSGVRLRDVATVSTCAPARIEDYGLLARQSIERSAAGPGSRAATRSVPRSISSSGRRPKPGEPSGRHRGVQGRPGWRTECVVMSLDLLGDGFDIHGGGIGPRVPAPRERACSGRSPGRPSPVTGSTTASSRSAARRCRSRSATSRPCPT